MFKLHSEYTPTGDIFEKIRNHNEIFKRCRLELLKSVEQKG